MKLKQWVIPSGIFFISGGLFWLIVATIANGTIENFDLPIIEFIQGMEVPSLTLILKTFTWIGSGIGVTVITLFICFILYFKEHRRAQAWLFAFTIVSTIALNEGLKRIFTRSRPEIHRLMDAGGYSFPSGHTMMAISLYAMIVYVFWPRLTTIVSRIALVITASFIAFLIAVSRIYVGVHYPSDIAGGFMMSTLWLTIVLLVYSLLKKGK